MRLKLIIFSALFPSWVCAQNYQYYSGPFGDGVASYRYFEDNDYNRIYDGPFEYEKANYGGSAIKIYGSYDNNLKSGLWIYANGIKDTLIGNYSKGKKNGEWRHILYNLKHDEINTIKRVTDFSFESNKYIGEFSIKSRYPQIEIKGQFNNKGLLEGEWRISYISYNEEKIEDISMYDNGFLYFRLKRNISSGEILKKVEKKELVISILKNIQEGDSTSVVDNQKYFLNRVKPSVQMIMNEAGAWNGNGIGLFKDSYFGSTPVKIDMRIKGEDADFQYLNMEMLAIPWEKSEPGLAEIRRNNAEIRRKNKFDYLIKEGDSFLRDNRYDQAISKYKEAAQVIESDIPTLRINKIKHIKYIEKRLNKAPHLKLDDANLNLSFSTFENYGMERLFQKSKIGYEFLLKQVYEVEGNAYHKMKSNNSDKYTLTDKQINSLKLAIQNFNNYKYRLFGLATEMNHSRAKKIQKKLKNVESPEIIIDLIMSEN